jgi:hypothetical protein
MKKLFIFLFTILSLSSFAQTTVRMSATATGTDTYSTTFNPTVSVFNQSTIYVLPFTNANTSGTVTIDPDAGGSGSAIAIKGADGNDLDVGAIVAGGVYEFKFNGTVLRMLGAWEQGTGAVTSVFSRTGAVTAATSDYDAVQIDNTPAGNLAATNAQAAHDELDTEKENYTKSINTFTADHTLALTDIDAIVSMNLTGTANNVTFPPNASVAIPIGSRGTIKQNGTGVTTIVAGAGVTVTPPAGGNLVAPAQGVAFDWLKTGTNTFDLYNGNAPGILSKVDDTNVTLTLGGDPTLALLKAVSVTVGWSGLLATARGGTGADNTTQTYTPTLTNSANITASTARQCTYSRNNNVVTVSGQFDIDPTTTLTLTTLGLSLPVASNFSTAFQAGGTASATTVADGSMGIFSDSTNDRVTIQYICTDVTNHTMTFSFTYQIL